MIRRLERLRGHAVLGALVSLTAKAGGSAAALVMFALAARVVDVDAFGRLVVTFNLVSLLAVVAVLGQDVLMQRAWGEYVERDPAAAHGILRFGIATTTLGAVVVALGFVGWSIVFDHDLSGGAIAAATAYLVSQTFLHFSAGLTRVVCGSLQSEPPRELFWRLPLVAALASAAFSGSPSSITAFFTIAAAGQFLTIAFLAGKAHRHVPRAVLAARPRFPLREWIGRSLAMTASAMIEAAHQYADVILIGLMLGPAEAAGFFVVMRIANIFPMLTSGIHTYSSSKVAHLHFSGRSEELKRLMAHVMGLALLMVVVAWGLVAFGGTWALGLFGAEYRVYYPELMIMCFVTGAATLAGPAPLMMLSMGEEVLYLKLVAAALAVRLAALIVFMSIWRMDGAIASAVIVLVPFVILLSIVCRRRLGIDPSVGAVFRVPHHP